MGIESSDRELVSHAQGGDATALNLLLERHYDRLYLLCRRLSGNDADAADACQEALLALVKGLAKFDNRSTFSTWSYRVAANATFDELRRRRRRPLIIPQEDLSSGSDLAGEVSDRVTLEAALVQLSPEFRAPIVLRDVIGMDYQEIASTLEVPVGTVRSRIARGRRKMADIVGNQQGDQKRQS